MTCCNWWRSGSFVESYNACMSITLQKLDIYQMLTPCQRSLFMSRRAEDGHIKIDIMDNASPTGYSRHLSLHFGLYWLSWTSAQTHSFIDNREGLSLSPQSKTATRLHPYQNRLPLSYAKNLYIMGIRLWPVANTIKIYISMPWIPIIRVYMPGKKRKG